MSNSSNTYTDDQLISFIKRGGQSRKIAIDYIYEMNNVQEKVMQYINKNGGNSNDGLDIFHDGLIILDRNIRSDKFKGEGSIAGYLYSICKFTWKNEWRKRFKTELVENPGEEKQVDSDYIPDFRKKERSKYLELVLDLLDESCRKILKLWQLSYSMEEIASQLKLSSPQLAKKYRYRCMKKLMSALDTHPDLLNTLRNV